MKKLLILTLVSAVLSGCSDSGQETACRNDLDCRAQQFLATADMFCKEKIEELGKPNMRWNEERDSQLLPRYEWKDKSKGTITYSGDKAEFKTQNGEYVKESYECDIDPDNEKAPVLDVRFKPGKLQPAPIGVKQP